MDYLIKMEVNLMDMEIDVVINKTKSNKCVNYNNFVCIVGRLRQCTLATYI